MILVVHPGSRIRNLIFYPSPDPGSRGQKGTGSRIRIRNTGFFPLPLFATYLCWRRCLTARMTSDGWMVFSTTLTVTLNVKKLKNAVENVKKIKKGVLSKESFPVEICANYETSCLRFISEK
jgi:hypothetical protein